MKKLNVDYTVATDTGIRKGHVRTGMVFWI